MPKPEVLSPFRKSEIRHALGLLDVVEIAGSIPEQADKDTLSEEIWNGLTPEDRLVVTRVVSAAFPGDEASQQKAARVALLLQHVRAEAAESRMLEGQIETVLESEPGL